jgi:hypothetical protein
MSPAEMAWRARDQVVQAAWSPRQVTRHRLARAMPAVPARELGSPRCCRRAPPRGCRTRPGSRCWRPRTGCCGRVGDPGGAPHRPGTARLVPRPGDRPPVRPGSYAFRVNHRSEERIGNVKQVWEISRLQHLTLLAGAWFAQPRRPVRAAGRRAPPLLVAGEPVPVRRALDQRHRARPPPDQPGLDPAPARRLAWRRPTCSSKTRWPFGRSAGTSSTSPRSPAAAPRPTTT